MSWIFIIKIIYNFVQKKISGLMESKNLIHEFFVFSDRLFKFSILDWREYLENDVIWQWVHSPMFTSRKTSQIWLVHFFIFKKSIDYFFVLKNFGVSARFCWWSHLARFVSELFDIDALLRVNCMIVHAHSFCLYFSSLSTLLPVLLLFFFGL